MQSKGRSVARHNRGRVVRILVLCCLAIAAPPAAADVGDSASGAGTNQTADSFEFSVTGGAADSAVGPPMLYQGVLFSAVATVNCLVVQGNRATVGGTIIASTNPSIVGNRLFFFVEDNGVPGAGQDRFEEGLLSAGAPCPAPLIAGPLLTEGNIVVCEASDKLKEHKKDPNKSKCKDKE